MFLSLPKILFALLLFFWLPIGIVSAHTLKTDGMIGVIMHIDPDDDPIAGQSANFYFEFEDKQNKFQPSLCNCQVTIAEGGQHIFSQTLAKTVSTGSMTGNGDFSFIFPKEDVYQLTLRGQPKTPGAFQPFTLEYDIRVDRSSSSAATSSTSGSTMRGMGSTNSSSSASPLYILAGAAGAAVLFGLISAIGLKLKTHNAPTASAVPQPQTPAAQTPPTQSLTNKIPPTSSNNP